MKMKVIKIGKIEIPFESVAEFFPEDVTEEEIAEIIEKALDMYVAFNKN